MGIKTTLNTKPNNDDEDKDTEIEKVGGGLRSLRINLISLSIVLIRE